MILHLTRVEQFNAAHRLWVDDWSPEKNFEVFGKCANPHFHGHNYELHVTVKGTPDPLTGMVCDARELGIIIRNHICDVLDHTNLNMDKNFIPLKTQPSTENLVYYIWMELVHLIPNGGKLHCVKLFETNKIYAEYYGE